MGWVTENLTSQTNGVATSFVTSHARVSGQLLVFLAGVQVEPATTPTATTFTITPAPANGTLLRVLYDTDETVDGRVIGSPEDPT